MRKHYPYSKKLRQFRYLAKRIARMLKDGENPEVSQRWIERLNRLYNELSGLFASRYLKRMAGAAVMVLALSFTSNAQSFGPPQENAFGLMSDDLADMALGDMDGDGDLDLITTDYYISYGYYYEYSRIFSYVENTGTPTAPMFSGTPVESPFNLPELEGFPQTIDLVDIDNDGDLDLLVGTLTVEYGSYYSYEIENELQLYRNIGTPSAPSFEQTPVPLVSTGDLRYMFSVADMDGDGDYDAIGSAAEFEYSGYYSYSYTQHLRLFRNNGGPNMHNFGQQGMPNPFGMDTTGLAALGFTNYHPECADFDNDGDVDVLLVGDSETDYDYYSGTYTTEDRLVYFENTGNPANPSFGAFQLNPTGFNKGDFRLSPGLVETGDLDNDGDDDLFLEGLSNSGYYSGQSVLYLENTGQSGNPGSVGDVVVNEGIDVFPNPSNGLVTIRLEDATGADNNRFELWNSIGQMVHGGALNNGRIDMDLTNYPSGVYTLSIHEEHLIRTTRLVKN